MRQDDSREMAMDEEARGRPTGPGRRAFLRGAVAATALLAGGSGLSADTVRASGASLGIAVQRGPAGARVAPEAVFFEAEPAGFDLPSPAGAAWYRPEMHEIEYEWDFGDPGAAYTATEHTLPDWQNANRGVGQVAAHVYRQPGTYTVTCTARKVVSLDPVTIHEATASAQVTVADPETVFSPAAAGAGTVKRTICVALDGDFTGADPEWAQATASAAGDPNSWTEIALGLLDDLRDNADSADDQGYIRVLFKRGETYPELLNDIERWSRTPVKLIHFGTWGDEADPAPVFNSYRQGRSVQGHGVPATVFDGLAFEGTYDPVTGSEGGGSSVAITQNDSPSLLVTGCTIRNYRDIGVYFTPWGDDRWSVGRPRLIIHDTKMDALGAYGLFGDDRQAPNDMSWIAMLGVQDLDVGNAPSGGADDTNKNEQGPVRAPARGLFISDGCEFFARFGWTTLAPWADGTTKTAAQSPFRIPSQGVYDGTGRWFITRCAAEGDSLISAGSAIATPTPYGNMLIDGFLHVCTATAAGTVGAQLGCLTVRNGLAIKPAPVAADVPRYERLVELNITKAPPGDVLVAGQFDAPVRIYNNTVVVLHAEAAPHSVNIVEDNSDLGTFTDVVEANNLIYAPNYPGQVGHLDFAPFDATELFGVRWLGRLEKEDTELRTDYAAPAGSVSLYQPQAGSPALGAVASGPVALFDLRGRRRGPQPAIGALDAG